MRQKLDDHQIMAEISFWSSTWDEFDYLRGFRSQFKLQKFNDYDEDGPAQPLGTITGWFGISVYGCPIADEADAISADSSTIGFAAQQILENQDWSTDLLEHVLLIDRIHIEEPLRGQGFLKPVFDTLVSTFGFSQSGCVLVTQPEPQQPAGGPYQNEAERSRALRGLQRSLRSAGFSPWDDGLCYWREVRPGEAD